MYIKTVDPYSVMQNITRVKNGGRFTSELSAPAKYDLLV